MKIEVGGLVALALGVSAQAGAAPSAAAPARHATPARTSFPAMAKEAALKAEIRRWYDQYLATYIRLGRGEETDARLLLNYLGVPFTVVTPDGVTTTMTEAERIPEIEANMKALRGLKYADAKATNLKITLLNPRAALIAGDWARYNDKGVAYDKFHSVYVVVRKDEGWRTTTIVRTPM